MKDKIDKISWPADKVERRPIDGLMPNKKNSRQHSDAQIEQIVASIQQWGWTIPVLVDEHGTLIAGHGRIMAAHRLGITEVPVMVADGWTEDQKAAYIIADNRIAEKSTWNQGDLADQLGDLSAAGFDLNLTGFDDGEVRDLIASDPVIPQKKEDLRPLKMTHILLSIPLSANATFLDGPIKQIIELGGRVDYGGN